MPAWSSESLDHCWESLPEKLGRKPSSGWDHWQGLSPTRWLTASRSHGFSHPPASVGKGRASLAFNISGSFVGFWVPLSTLGMDNPMPHKQLLQTQSDCRGRDTCPPFMAAIIWFSSWSHEKPQGHKREDGRGHGERLNAPSSETPGPGLGQYPMCSCSFVTHGAHPQALGGSKGHPCPLGNVDVK